MINYSSMRYLLQHCHYKINIYHILFSPPCSCCCTVHTHCFYFPPSKTVFSLVNKYSLLSPISPYFYPQYHHQVSTGQSSSGLQSLFTTSVCIFYFTFVCILKTKGFFYFQLKIQGKSQ